MINLDPFVFSNIQYIDSLAHLLIFLLRAVILLLRNFFNGLCTNLKSVILCH